MDLIHLDNGDEFVNSEIDELLRLHGMREIHGRPYHLQSQGQIERFNRTLKSQLRKTVDPDIYI